MLPIDPAVKQRHDASACLRWPCLVDDQSRTNFDYFSLMYPLCGLDCLSVRQTDRQWLGCSCRFSSVKTLLALQERGLHFMWMVKTSHKEYPLAYLKSWALGHEREKRTSERPESFCFCFLLEAGMWVQPILVPIASVGDTKSKW